MFTVKYNHQNAVCAVVRMAMLYGADATFTLRKNPVTTKIMRTRVGKKKSHPKNESVGALEAHAAQTGQVRSGPVQSSSAECADCPNQSSNKLSAKQPSSSLHSDLLWQQLAVSQRGLYQGPLPASTASLLVHPSWRLQRRLLEATEYGSRHQLLVRRLIEVTHRQERTKCFCTSTHRVLEETKRAAQKGVPTQWREMEREKPRTHTTPLSVLLSLGTFYRLTLSRSRHTLSLYSLPLLMMSSVVNVWACLCHLAFRLSVVLSPALLSIGNIGALVLLLFSFCLLSYCLLFCCFITLLFISALCYVHLGIRKVFASNTTICRPRFLYKIMHLTASVQTLRAPLVIARSFDKNV